MPTHNKALLIKSVVEKEGNRGGWNKLEDDSPTAFIEGILTNKQDEEIKSEHLNALVSGVPSPWARPKLFKFAFDTLNRNDASIPKNGALMKFYEIVLQEWKGLIALMALYPTRFRISDPISLSQEGSGYEISHAFGDMLFDEKDLWSDQKAMRTNEEVSPYIQLIYYQEHLVGATSPYTGIFTAVNYSLETDAPEWYKGNKLTDPLPFLNADDCKKLFLFVKNLSNNHQAYSEVLNSRRGKKRNVKLSGLQNVSRNFLREIQKKCSDLDDATTGMVAKFSQFAEPFASLFNSSNPVYYIKEENRFTYIKGEGAPIKYEDMQDLLLPANGYVIGWVEEDTENKDSQSLNNSLSYFLRVNVEKNGKKYRYYFTIPLTEEAIEIEKNEMDVLLGYQPNGQSKMKLEAELKGDDILSVTLYVTVDGQMTPLTPQDYHIKWSDGMQKMIVWPNFESDDWCNYYLYSEFIKSSGISFKPIYKTTNGNGFIKNANNSHFFSPQQFDAQETIGLSEPLSCTRLVTYPEGKVETGKPRYNVLYSSRPIAGMQANAHVRGHDYDAGYLIVRPEQYAHRQNPGELRDVTVGFDFGSSNSCVYYKAEDHESSPIEFLNNRAVIVGRESADVRANATNDELLFISNYTDNNIQRGQIKSWLHDHDPRYVENQDGKEIADGVPVYRPNIEVRRMDRYEIQTQAGTLHYNMKWLSSQRDRNKKWAYVKTVWLQACAFLYLNGYKPNKLYWSYPGSMQDSDVTNLERMFNSLSTDVLPIKDTRIDLKKYTEAEAVCQYATNLRYNGLANDNMILGIDVGGSTSDILLLARDVNKPRLYRESSVRIAAGAFFDAVKDSKQFRRALISFHESRVTGVFVNNIGQIDDDKDKAPYYLNSIFDQLEQKDYGQFYQSISMKAPFVFTIPAYVTGFLLFYSGILVGTTLKEKGLNNVTKVIVQTFGKGGRLFHWLNSYPGNSTATKYFEDCVLEGISIVDPGTSVEKVTIDDQEDLKIQNKAEVAIGLCKRASNPGSLIIDDDIKNSDVCGERDVTFTGDDGPENLNPESRMESRHFENGLGGLDTPCCDVFMQFANMFFDFVSVKTDMYKQIRQDMSTELVNLPTQTLNEIRNDSEYEKACHNGQSEFTYNQSILVAEASSFLKSIIKRLFN